MLNQIGSKSLILIAAVLLWREHGTEKKVTRKKCKAFYRNGRFRSQLSDLVQESKSFQALDQPYSPIVEVSY